MRFQVGKVLLQIKTLDRSRRGEAAMRYAIVIEKAESNYSAYVPDLPGCAATGASLDEVDAEIRGAIEFHLEGMREDGVPIPTPQSKVGYVGVSS